MVLLYIISFIVCHNNKLLATQCDIEVRVPHGIST